MPYIWKSNYPISENQILHEIQKTFIRKLGSQKPTGSIVFGGAYLNALHAIYSQQKFKDICQIPGLPKKKDTLH